MGTQRLFSVTTKRKTKIHCMSKMQLLSVNTGCVCTTTLEKVIVDRL